jgi:hypothetical protein
MQKLRIRKAVNHRKRRPVTPKMDVNNINILPKEFMSVKAVI